MSKFKQILSERDRILSKTISPGREGFPLLTVPFSVTHEPFLACPTRGRLPSGSCNNFGWEPDCNFLGLISYLIQLHFNREVTFLQTLIEVTEFSEVCGHLIHKTSIRMPPKRRSVIRVLACLLNKP